MSEGTVRRIGSCVKNVISTPRLSPYGPGVGFLLLRVRKIRAFMTRPGECILGKPTPISLHELGAA